METLLLFATGAVAGLLGGLLGIGGGIILMPALRFYVGLSPAVAAGTCIIAVFFTTLGGSLKHYRSGYLKFRPIMPVILSGALFTLLFSVVFVAVARREYLIDLGIAAVFFLVSLRMTAEGFIDLFREPVSGDYGALDPGRAGAKIATGAGAGIFPGLLGIGTGAVLVPAFRFVLKAPIKTAIASSLACFAVNAAISSVFKIVQGFADVRVGAIVSIGTLTGAATGAALNSKTPPAFLKILFGTLFFLVSLRYAGVI